MPPRKTKPPAPILAQLPDYYITVAGSGLVRFDMHSQHLHTCGFPHFVAHIWTVEETMELARKLTSAALQAAGERPKKR